MARNESSFEDSRKHEFMSGLDLRGSAGLLNLFATLEELYNNECSCFECEARRGEQKSKKEDSALFRKKSPEHILADASIKGVQAHGEALSKHLFGSIQEFHVENAELAKKQEELKKQLVKQKKLHSDEMDRQSEEFKDALVNFRKKVEADEFQMESIQDAITAAEEEKEVMQKSIEGKVQALKQRAVEVKNLEEEKDVLQTAFNTIAGFVEEVNKDLRKPELKVLVENVAETVKVTEGLMEGLS